jgi:hypothetical protein
MGYAHPRPVIDCHGHRVGWADSEEGPTLVGPLDDDDLDAWESEGRYIDDPKFASSSAKEGD